MKLAVITGAANGIGLALTKACLKPGHTVVMVDKNQSKLTHEAEQLALHFPSQVLSFACDITREDEVNQLLQWVDAKKGRVDLIFNNAGIIGALNPVWELTQEDLSCVMNVNVYGMMNVIRTFMPYLFKQEIQAHIVNIASLYALCSGSYLASYAMSKHAVLALSESLYFDLKRLNKPVDVSVAFPSFTDTSLFANPAYNQSALHGSLNNLLAHSRPAEDIAEHILEAVEKKQFYILPDKEVKGYCDERTQSIIHQETPHTHAIEKLMRTLIRRSIS